ncbi:hypothetical protein X943_001810 [Babesia divergens]|uniref:Homologous-pairing protein 2 winged helix domain-containing protein n=1 Tax=Babesia divergens TaxID=32595 RepID=A0AAD9GD29_BABDI|nr:hypothetical protein X943_001810 [Babesia divergens]
MDAVLRYLKDIRRPCSIAEIHKHLGSHLAMKHVVDVMLKLVENGNIQYKVYNNSLQIFIQLEEEVDRMRAELQQKRRQLASLRQTQAIFQKLLQLQEKHNAALDNWHRAFCGDVRFHGIVQEQDIECRILIERYQEMRLFCERLKYLYTNFLGTICGLEGMLVEEVYENLGIRDSILPHRNFTHNR